MNILFLYADRPDEWNCSEWRCMVPARMINASGKAEAKTAAVSDFAYQVKETLELCAWADLIVLQRNAFGIVVPFIEVQKAHGKKLVVDLDDDYHHMPVDLAAYKFWIGGQMTDESGALKRLKISPLKQLEWGIKLSDGVVSPSRLILHDWHERLGVRGWWLPNLIEPSVYPLESHTNEKIVIGWGGSDTHHDSFHESGLTTALRRVVQKRDVIVHIAGSGESIFRDLRLPLSKGKRTKWVPYAQWPAIVNSFDIGLAPLWGVYDQHRSWLKGLEYSYLGIPWIGTEGEPYEELFQMGYGVPVANRARDWEEALLGLIDNQWMSLPSGMDNLTWPGRMDEVLSTFEEILNQ